MIKTGFTMLDELVKSGGFAKGELMVFVAGPSTERKSMIKLPVQQDTLMIAYEATKNLHLNLQQSKSDI